MPDRRLVSELEGLRREVAEKSLQLSDLDVMLADYQAERGRLIRDLRRLQSVLREAEENLRQAADQNRPHEQPGDKP